MKLSEIRKMNIIELKSLSNKELMKAQKQLMRERNKRAKAFNKAGYSRGIPNYIGNIKSERAKSKIISNINKLSNWMQNKSSTPRGYAKVQRERRKAIEEALGIEFKSKAEFDEFGRFMGEMQNRAGQMWDVQSMSGADLFVEAKRLNLNPMQLLKNYDDWMEHVKDLEKIDKPLPSNMNPSWYTRKLNLPSIKKFYHDLEENRERANARRKKR